MRRGPTQTNVSSKKSLKLYKYSIVLYSYRVTILQGLNFLFSYCFLHGPYNSAALLRYL